MNEATNRVAASIQKSNTQGTAINPRNNLVHEIISLDGEEDEEDDDIFQMAIISHSDNENAQQQSGRPSNELNTRTTEANVTKEPKQSKSVPRKPNEMPGAVSQKDEAAEKEQPEKDPSEAVSSRQNHSEIPQPDRSNAKVSEITPQKRGDANNNSTKTGQQNETSGTFSNKEVKTKSDYRPSIKRKATSISPQRFVRIRRVEYLPDSDEETESESTDRNRSKTKTRKRTNERPHAVFKLPQKKQNRNVTKTPVEVQEKVSNQSTKKVQTDVPRSIEVVGQKNQVNDGRNEPSKEARDGREVQPARTECQSERKNMDQSHHLFGSGSESDSSSDCRDIFADDCQRDAQQQRHDVVRIEGGNKENESSNREVGLENVQTQYQTQKMSQPANNNDIESDSDTSSDDRIIFPD